MNAVWPNGDPRDVVHALLAKPPFAGQTADATAADPLLAVLRWIGARLGALFGTIGHALGAEARYAPLVGGLTVAAIGMVVIVVALRLVNHWVQRRPRASFVRAGAPADGRRSSAAWLADALAAAREQRWRDAAAALVHAALAGADETGRLPYDPARTPAEAGRMLRDPAFTAFVRDADIALFAANGAGAERFERMHAAYAQLASRT